MQVRSMRSDRSTREELESMPAEHLSDDAPDRPSTTSRRSEADRTNFSMHDSPESEDSNRSHRPEDSTSPNRHRPPNRTERSPPGRPSLMRDLSRHCLKLVLRPTEGTPKVFGTRFAGVGDEGVDGPSWHRDRSTSARRGRLVVSARRRHGSRSLTGQGERRVAGGLPQK